MSAFQKLLAALPSSLGQPVDMSSREWASVTFKGSRIKIGWNCTREQADYLLSSPMPLKDITLDGHIVSDYAATEGVTYEGKVWIETEFLTVEDH